MNDRYSVIYNEEARMHRAQVNHYVVYYEVDDSQMEVIIIRIFYDGQDVEGITSHISTDN